MSANTETIPSDSTNACQVEASGSHKGVAITFAGIAAVIIALGLILYALTAKAEESRQVVETVQAIQANQLERAALKPQLAECAVIEAADAKLAEDNTGLVARLASWGYAYDWATDEARPFTPGTSSAR